MNVYLFDVLWLKIKGGNSIVKEIVNFVGNTACF